MRVLPRLLAGVAAAFLAACGSGNISQPLPSTAAQPDVLRAASASATGAPAFTVYRSPSAWRSSTSWTDDLTTDGTGQAWYSATHGLQRRVGATVSYEDIGVPGSTIGTNLTRGLDGNIYFIASNGTTAQLERIKPNGDRSLFPIANNPGIINLATGNDGLLYGFAQDNTAMALVVMTTSGVIEHQYVTPVSFAPYYIERPIAIDSKTNTLYIQSSDGWGNNVVIDRISPTGQLLATYPVSQGGDSLFNMAVTPDGNLWYTRFSQRCVMRVTVATGTEQCFAPPSNQQPGQLAVAPDGSLWFAEYYWMFVGHIAANGTVTEVRSPVNDSYYITVAPASSTAVKPGTLWLGVGAGWSDMMEGQF